MSQPSAEPHEVLHELYKRVRRLGNVGWRNDELSTPAIDALRANAVEMQRMYGFKYCSPSRSSFLSGRLPLHVTQNNKNNDITNGVDLRMTLLPQKLRRE